MIFDFKDNELLELAEEQMSTNFKNNIEYVLRKLNKLYKKQKSNDYVITRDVIILGLIFLIFGIEDIDSCKTTTQGRQDLIELKEKIFDKIKKVYMDNE